MHVGIDPTTMVITCVAWTLNLYIAFSSLGQEFGDTGINVLFAPSIFL